MDRRDKPGHDALNIRGAAFLVVVAVGDVGDAAGHLLTEGAGDHLALVLLVGLGDVGLFLLDGGLGRGGVFGFVGHGTALGLRPGRTPDRSPAPYWPISTVSTCGGPSFANRCSTASVMRAQRAPRNPAMAAKARA